MSCRLPNGNRYPKGPKPRVKLPDSSEARALVVVHGGGDAAIDTSTTTTTTTTRHVLHPAGEHCTTSRDQRTTTSARTSET